MRRNSFCGQLQVPGSMQIHEIGLWNIQPDWDANLQSNIPDFSFVSRSCQQKTLVNKKQRTCEYQMPFVVPAISPFSSFPTKEQETMRHASHQFAMHADKACSLSFVPSLGSGACKNDAGMPKIHWEISKNPKASLDTLIAVSLCRLCFQTWHLCSRKGNGAWDKIYKQQLN